MRKDAQKFSIVLAAALLLLAFAYQQISLSVYADDSYRTAVFDVDIRASEDNSFAVNETIDAYDPKNGQKSERCVQRNSDPFSCRNDCCN